MKLARTLSGISRCLPLTITAGLIFAAICPVANAQSGKSGTATTPTAGTGQTYTLRYKLEKGEALVSRVIHLAETSTMMNGSREESRSRTTSEKVWEITDVSDDGKMTFEYRINFVNLAQSIGEAEELKYNSVIDTDVPDIFKAVAETVNKPLATITINSRGQVTDRDNELNAPQMGVGEITVPLPEEAIAVGSSWSVPRELRVKLDNGAFKKIQVRELYTLEKVVAGLATISIVTQPLTPIADPAIDAQLIQQLSKGTLKFDIDSGRLLSKALEWRDEVIGFRGPKTSLSYSATFTEELQTEPKRTARRQ